jgi:MoxR-like ATPase
MPRALPRTNRTETGKQVNQKRVNAGAADSLFHTKSQAKTRLSRAFCYGASRARTGDLLGAIQALSQLSYSPAQLEV